MKKNIHEFVNFCCIFNTQMHKNNMVNCVHIENIINTGVVLGKVLDEITLD